MNDVDTLIQALKQRKKVVVLHGHYTKQNLNDLFNAAWKEAQSDFHDGVSWNASFTDERVEYIIEYSPIDARPNTPSPEPKPKPSSPQIETQNKPNSGGIRGFFQRLFTPTPTPETNPNPNNPKPKTPQNQPKPITKHIPLEDLNAPMPAVDAFTSVIYHHEDSFLDLINVNKGLTYHINGSASDLNEVHKVISRELGDYVILAEGVTSASGRTRCSHGMGTYILELIHGLSKDELYYDHLAKGRSAARPTMQRLTHNGDMPLLMKIYLAYAFFQNEITYNLDYAAQRNIKPNANMHMGYGPLMLKKGVCEGYAWALVHLLAVLGVPATLAHGKLKRMGDHAWVKLELDGQIYNLDPTIQKNPKGIVINFFLKSDAYFQSAGYSEINHRYDATDNKYDDTDKLIALLLRYREDAMRKGGDRNILSQDIIKGVFN